MNGIDFDIITRYELKTNAPAGHVLLGEVEVVCHTPDDVRRAIADAVRALGQLAAKFDMQEYEQQQQQKAARLLEQAEREQAILVAPSLLERGERHGKIEI